MDLYTESDLHLQLSVRSICIEDKYESPWSRLLATREDSLALSIDYKQHGEYQALKARHDVELSVNVATITMTFRNR